MKMNQNDYHRIHAFYTKALTENAETSAKSVQWTDEHQQTRRFDILMGIEDSTQNTLLDVGCGLGAFYDYLKQHQRKGAYTGIDLIPEYIESAKSRFPEARFLEGDIFEVTEKFDYVFASGALSFKVEDNQSYAFEMIKKMYEIADKGVAFNMLNEHSHIDNETYATYSPKEVSDFCHTFSSHVEVAIGYLPKDFTIYLYRNKFL